MDSHLSNNSYFANNKYSIADISIFPWVARYSWHGIEIEKFGINRWFKLITERFAVRKEWKSLFKLNNSFYNLP